MGKRAKILLFAGIVLAGVVALALPKLPDDEDGEESSAQQAENTALPVETFVAEPGLVEDKIKATGTILPNEEVSLRSEVSGMVTEIAFQEGRSVQEGDLLMKVNDSELQAQRTRIGHQISLKEDNVARQRQLVEKGGVSQEEYETTLNELEVLRADLQLINAQIEKTELRAPFDGVIGLRHVSPGSYISPSTEIATLQDVSSVKIEFSIPERYASKIQLGDGIFFAVEGVEGQYEGQIYAYEPKISADTRSLTIRARSDNVDGELLPGAFSDIEVVFERIDDALLVPAISVIAQDGEKTVYVYENGAAQPRQVTTGLRTEQSVRILEGLAPGDTVITSGVQQLRAGLEVRVDSADN